MIEILLLEALVYQQQHATPRALQALEEALVLAEPEGYLRLFLDEGAPMCRLLTTWLRYQQRRSASSHQLLVYVKKVLGVFGATLQEDAHRAKRHQERLQTSLPPLSEREQEILRHLAEGKSNEEIAAGLVLEVSTVKWHLTRIYSKLNAQNRTQAVLQAKKFQLL